jgi:hypothetical protein
LFQTGAESISEYLDARRWKRFVQVCGHLSQPHRKEDKGFKALNSLRLLFSFARNTNCSRKGAKEEMLKAQRVELVKLLLCEIGS